MRRTFSLDLDGMSAYGKAARIFEVMSAIKDRDMAEFHMITKNEVIFSYRVEEDI